MEWYDVDYPAVIELREQVYPARERCHLVATSATDESWLDQIPSDRPVLLLAEGISMYLTESDGLALLRRVVSQFPGGELQIDFYNWLAVKTQKTQTLMRQTGSTLHWAVNGPQDILSRLPGVRLLAAVTFFDASTFNRAPATFRLAGRLVTAIPPLRRHFNTTATHSGRSADADCRLLLGNVDEQRPHQLDRPLGRRPVRVVLDIELPGEYRVK